MTYDSNIQSALTFFIKAIPDPKSKNFHTQLGVHFEEVAEMLETLRGRDRVTQALLTSALISVMALSMHLKNKDFVVDLADPLGFLDSLCDQMVTATGAGYMADMDIVSAFAAVNRSNRSKFDANGDPILDANQKIIKGPRYKKANLEPFLGYKPQ
jgi:predicted HAD superfamily Cof-like phosphohydrolase